VTDIMRLGLDAIWRDDADGLLDAVRRKKRAIRTPKQSIQCLCRKSRYYMHI